MKDLREIHVHSGITRIKDILMHLHKFPLLEVLDMRKHAITDKHINAYFGENNFNTFPHLRELDLWFSNSNNEQTLLNCLLARRELMPRLTSLSYNIEMPYFLFNSATLFASARPHLRVTRHSGDALFVRFLATYASKRRP